jgi:uncharacterized protein (TIGR02186 family)
MIRQLIIILACLAAMAQSALAQPEAPNPENIQIGLSTDRFSIRSDFGGADLTIFGALENVDPLVSRHGRYDVIVVLEGPARPLVVRKKTRVLGMWINTESVSFVNVPASYSVATTRAFQDIANTDAYQQLALGVENVHLQPMNPDGSARTVAEFTAALRERKRATGLYSERLGGVEFLSQNLFRATVALAPNVPVGTHRARAFLFKNSIFVRETSVPLVIYKAGIEQTIFTAAHQYSLLYGLFAVALAMLTGWAGSIIFRRE